MGFKTVGQGSITFKKLTELKVGESVTGYLLGIDTSTKIEGAQNLRLRIDGTVFSYSAAGNVKYMIRDGELQFGQNTRITRLEDRKVKGKSSSNFKVEQDPDDVVEGAPATNQMQATVKASSSIADKIKGLKANATASPISTAKA
jgi:hypothetical protein